MTQDSNQNGDEIAGLSEAVLGVASLGRDFTAKDCIAALQATHPRTSPDKLEAAAKRHIEKLLKGRLLSCKLAGHVGKEVFAASHGTVNFELDGAIFVEENWNTPFTAWSLAKKLKPNQNDRPTRDLEERFQLRLEELARLGHLTFCIVNPTKSGRRSQMFTG